MNKRSFLVLFLSLAIIFSSFSVIATESSSTNDCANPEKITAKDIRLLCTKDCGKIHETATFQSCVDKYPSFEKSVLASKLGVSGLQSCLNQVESFNVADTKLTSVILKCLDVVTADKSITTPGLGPVSSNDIQPPGSDLISQCRETPTTDCCTKLISDQLKECESVLPYQLWKVMLTESPTGWERTKWADGLTTSVRSAPAACKFPDGSSEGRCLIGPVNLIPVSSKPLGCEYNVVIIADFKEKKLFRLFNPKTIMEITDCQEVNVKKTGAKGNAVDTQCKDTTLGGAGLIGRGITKSCSGSANTDSKFVTKTINSEGTLDTLKEEPKLTIPLNAIGRMSIAFTLEGNYIPPHTLPFKASRDKLLLGPDDTSLTPIVKELFVRLESSAETAPVAAVASSRETGISKGLSSLSALFAPKEYAKQE